MSKRKLWATSFSQIAGDKHRHESQAATYRYVREQGVLWHQGALRSPHLVVHVDTREGLGWQAFERIDLRELPGVAR